jgi:hypothetical protein
LKALFTFKHQTIYNPIDKQMQPLTPFGDSFDWRFGVDYLGEILDPATSESLAMGRLHPTTLQPVVPPKPDLDGDIDTSEPFGREEKPRPTLQAFPPAEGPKKDIGTIVWSSICAVNSDRLSEHPQLINLDQDVCLSPIEPISKAPPDLWTFETITESRDDKGRRSSDIPRSPLAISKNAFTPLTGVEILHRRKKRISSDSSSPGDLQLMITERNPWATKKSKSSPIFLSSPLPTNAHLWSEDQLVNPVSPLFGVAGGQSIHDTLRLASLERDQTERNLIALEPSALDIHSSDTLHVESQRAAVTNEILFDPSSNRKNFDRFRQAGIIKYQPRQLPHHPPPFTLPKKYGNEMW